MRALALTLLAALAVVPAAGSTARGGPIPSSVAKTAITKVEEALQQERTALGVIGQKHPGIAPNVYLYGSANRLEEAIKAISGYDGAAPIKSQLDEAGIDDHNAVPLGSKGKDIQGQLKLVQKAIAAKKKAIGLLANYAVSTSSPTCEVTKPFPVFAVPAGYAGSNSDVFPHGIPRGAKDIQVSFVDEATGRAPGPHPFPGQSWSDQVRGFQPDGEFDVHVNVTGKGLGKPNANAKNWEVVVRFAC